MVMNRALPWKFGVYLKVKLVAQRFQEFPDWFIGTEALEKQTSYGCMKLYEKKLEF